VSKKSGGAKKKMAEGSSLVCTNASASKYYDIEERYEAGMVLAGSEVKSLRERKGDLDGSYATLMNGELWIHKMHIGAYEQASVFGHESKASRKLLLNASEIRRMSGKLTVRGYTLVPLKVYFKNGWAKVEIGLAKGKKTADRRDDLRKKTAMREVREAMKPRTGGK
jgi:SsrA-binding protein